jgi:CspA family cold shock protein
VNKKNHEQKTREIKLVPESDEVFLGKIKFFNEQKGYGFIVPEDDQQDVFFHQTSVVGASHLDAGEPIEFKVSKTVKGVVAIDIKSAAYN